jgi:hypothetical protein
MEGSCSLLKSINKYVSLLLNQSDNVNASWSVNLSRFIYVGLSFTQYVSRSFSECVSHGHTGIFTVH